ncbi:hypothetical protein [Clostridium sp.]|uniref:hypothetical protein n=1 Tax=Clostridium sp. TaxID=1506 RepID=UPI001A58BECF|nr:hypothetical protein [Clostridium sp.]MBK5243171.1 hypothetical protein [Clostridium sp.]
MMITTEYTHALGDYVVEFIGLKSWTGEYSGTHLTVFYFSALAILGLVLVRKYAMDGLGIRTRNLLFSLIAFITIFSLATNITAINVKKYSDGLLSVGFNSKNSRMEYKTKSTVYTEFNAEIEMKNYGNESKEFYLAINNPFYREEGNEHIDIFTKDGNKAIFRLNGNETKTFEIDLDEYKIKGGRLSINGGGKGVIEEVFLTNVQGNSIRLERNNFFGVEMNR